ncbi:hypothetical protein GRF59_14905 [Paenibacillus sp. HJL G12]|uniref:Uncharacterized protein n=1 Tax=Paenibacillus dendrobii TaxID=2691084 RepID=A0A7X3IJ36_9BACL|nr:hypothetical protein [Paenibacillus dendrobii]MWV44909.1 hypothetical protein [Paenibacillus dendrobii]
MTRGWYGLYLGDRVKYDYVGQQIEGTIVELSTSDKNGGIIIDDKGEKHKVVCEYCKRIQPTDNLFTFRPLNDVQYTVLIYSIDNVLDVYTFLGNEIDEKVKRIIKYTGDEISRLEIYVRETSSNLNALYQVLEQSDVMWYFNEQ